MNIQSLLTSICVFAITSTQATTWSSIDFIDQGVGILYPKVAASASSNAVCSWTEPNSVTGEMQANGASYRTVTGWGTGVTLSATGGNAYHSNCYMDTAGNGLAIWARQITGTNNSIIQASYIPAITRAWSTAANISTSGQTSNSPVFDFNNSTGNGLAIWNNLSTTQIEGAFFTALTVSWGTPVAISGTAADMRGLQVVVTSSGKAIAMWQEYNSSLDIYNLKSRIYNGTTWLAINTFANTSSNVAKNNLAIDNAGNALATWYDTDASSLMYSTCAAASTTWSTPAAIGSPRPIFGADLAVVPANGNATLVCITYNGTFEFAQAINYTLSTNTWSAPVAISTLSAGYAQSPSVTIDSNNNPVAVWTRYNNTGFFVETSSFSAGSWSAPLALSNPNKKNPFPEIASSPSLVLPVVQAIWSQDFSGSSIIVIQRLIGSP